MNLSTDVDDLPPRPQTQLSKKALRIERRKKLREHRQQVQKITKRLYEIKHPPDDIEEHREVQTHVLNLRQITRQVRNERPHGGLSTIHNMSLTMIEDIKGAKVSKEMLGFTEEDEEDEELMMRQHSVQFLPSRKSHSGTLASGNQLKVLTTKMEQILHNNSLELAEVERQVAARHQKHKITGGVGLLISKSLMKSRHSTTISPEFPKAEAELVRTQLRRDVKRLETKIRLLVSSVLILEDEIKKCGSESFADKRKILQKRINSIYALMDFLKQTKRLASDYIQQIEEVLFGDEEAHNGDKFMALIHDIDEMVKAGKAVDFVTSKIEARSRGNITKKELVKYKQVTFARVLPAILNAACKNEK